MPQPIICIDFMSEGSFRVTVEPTARSYAAVFYFDMIAARNHAEKWHRESGWPIFDKTREG